MIEAKTNFARLLKLLGARPRDLCEAVGADKAMVSRWTSGKQKLMPGHGWIDRVADYLLALDARLKHPLLPDLLAAYYPGEQVGTQAGRRAVLLRWLAQMGHKSALHQESGGIVGLVLDKVENLKTSKPDDTAEDVPSPYPQNAVVYGVSGVQGSALQFLEMVAQQAEPTELQFVCPEGLDMLTKDKKFHSRFMDAVMDMFGAGHTMGVVVRTDYRVSDIAEFSGRWLVAHLLGYVKSYYYDDFVGVSKDKILAAVPGVMAGRVSETEDGQLYTAIRFDKETVDGIGDEIRQYQQRSKPRFHYHLFEHSDGFLRGVHPLPDKPHYQFVRLPHFCVAERGEFQGDFGLSDTEMALLERDFAPILFSPDFYDTNTAVRHILCEADIEDALLKSRHVSQELSAILGRRVVMPTQALVDRLVTIKKLMAAHPNYEICFLPDEVFQKLQMQIAAWGDAATIGWIANGKSTACRDYTNVNALTGFCEVVWEKMIPGVVKSRSAGRRKLNTLLKMAAKYGYVV